MYGIHPNLNQVLFLLDCPNPAQSWVHLVNFEAANDRDYQLAIYDLTGRVVKTVPRWSNKNIDVSHLLKRM